MVGEVLGKLVRETAHRIASPFLKAIHSLKACTPVAMGPPVQNVR